MPPPSALKLRRQILEAISISGSVSRHSAPDPALWRQVELHQIRHNPVFRRWRENDGPDDGPAGLPLVAFKESVVSCFRPSTQSPWFESSGTTAAGQPVVSRHWFHSPDLYRASVIAGWRWFCRSLEGEAAAFEAEPPFFAGVMPSSREAPHSSLSRMVEILMSDCGSGSHGFWCMKSGRWDWTGFCAQLERLRQRGCRVVLFGTAFGWVHFLDWCGTRRLRFHLPHGSLVVETGGYKGRSREMDRAVLHAQLGARLGVESHFIRSEYSMCELSSQAWSFPASQRRDRPPRAFFRFPPWCRWRVVRPGSTRTVARDETGVLEIEDLANLDSCAFLRTEDLVIDRGDGFEMTGRLPHAELKGCSLAFESGAEKPRFRST